ncbi:Phosphoglycerate kinase [uncultured archaeon]|nr:Phosphoglycerate kinase [uncultured archaeon]
MAAPRFLTLDDRPLPGQTVFVRVDLNCPVDEKTKKPQLSPRVSAHARTVLDLSRMGAKTVVLAHQGRKGDDDFISLAPHAKMLEQEVKKLAAKAGLAPKSSPAIQFVDDVCGPKAKSAIRSLKGGEVVLLQNVRYLDDETKFEKNGGKSELVSSLSPLCDVFVLDAFSCAHRAHASVVGFGLAGGPGSPLSSIPCLAGRVMQQELSALDQFHNPKHPVVFALGGAKPADSLPILQAWLEAGKLDFALCGGVLGSLMLLASGHELGATRAYLEKKEVLADLPAAKALLEKYSQKIILPSDVVVEEKDGGAPSRPAAPSAGAPSPPGVPVVLSADRLPSPYSILDIGPETSRRFSDYIRAAGSVVLNGPMGVYEQPAFASGTRVVLTAVSESPAFSLLGGGHTLSALAEFKINQSKLGYVSLSGKALIEYLSGEKLPGVELLREWGRKRAGNPAKAAPAKKGRAKSKRSK